VTGGGTGRRHQAPDSEAEGQVMRAHPEGTLVRLRVVAGARRTELAGVAGQALRVRIAAPPAQGRANAAILGYLAGLVGLRARDLEITAGEHARDKLLLVRGRSPAQVRAALLDPPGR
jgi:uncharacterized protein (TIGR00251 family)